MNEARTRRIASDSGSSGWLITVLFTVTFLAIGTTGARADSACASLPIDTNYVYSWFTGGHQLHTGVTLTDTRGYLRTYNPFAANTPDPYMGDSSAWIMLDDSVSGKYAQVGWAKTPSSPAILRPVVFVQIKDNSLRTRNDWFTTPTPSVPDVFFYQVSTNRAGTWSFYWAGPPGYTVGTLETITDSIYDWQPDEHQAFAEVHNYTGDQLAGDNTAHMTFRDIAWADGFTWYGSSFGGASNPYVYGDSVPAGGPDRGTAGFDHISWTDGSNFDTWDGRCG